MGAERTTSLAPGMDPYLTERVVCRYGRTNCPAMHGSGHVSLAVDANGEFRWWMHAPDMDLARLAVEAGLLVWTIQGDRVVQIAAQPNPAAATPITVVHVFYNKERETLAGNPGALLIPEHTLDLLAAQAVESIQQGSNA